MGQRVGIGIDAHRFITGRPLILGGVPVPAEFGLEAHSDGDVLAHAILDALLGAANLGDKGTHFPPSDSAYKDIHSIVLVERAVSLIAGRGGTVVNVDSTIICEQPKLGAHIPHMKTVLAKALKCKASAVSIKATTTERMGFTGRGEGIAAMAVVLLDIPDHFHDD